MVRQEASSGPSNFSQDVTAKPPPGGPVEVLKVSSRSNPNSVAGAMAGVVRQTGAVEVQVVGAGALNQAVKAIAIARGYLTPSNVDLVCIPTFADIEIDGESRTAIRLSVEDRTHRLPSESTSAGAPAAKADGERQPAHATI
jgi:stage V sporulation protein S